MPSGVLPHQSPERLLNVFRCVQVAIRRDSPFAARMLADQLVLRTEQPFPKPLLDFAGALTTQGPNLTSIVRHGY